MSHTPFLFQQVKKTPISKTLEKIDNKKPKTYGDSGKQNPEAKHHPLSTIDSHAI